MLKCPICETGLRIVTRHAVEIDYCNHCRGVWLDCYELDEIVMRAQQANPHLPALNLPMKNTPRQSEPRPNAAHSNAPQRNMLHNMARRNYRGVWCERKWNDALPQDSYSHIRDERRHEEDCYYDKKPGRHRDRRDAFDTG